MKTWPHSTLAALLALGTVAAADDATAVDTADVIRPDVGSQPAVETFGRSSSSARGVAQDYLVLPAGGELTSQMRFLTSQPVFGADEVRFSDLALFGLGARWSVFERLEISGQVDLLAKQPSYTDEKPWQSVALGLRTPIGTRAALAIGGAGGHLIDHRGMWTRQAVTIQWRKPIMEFMTFDLAAGGNGISLSGPGPDRAFIGEIAGSASANFHAQRVWGAWVGIGYAVPLIARGSDPTTGMAVDPQPRLDLRIGTVLSLVKEWDLYAELAVVDRGDLADPTTRLPILDGGFDQQQVILGVTRHLEGKPKPNRDPMMISTR